MKKPAMLFAMLVVLGVVVAWEQSRERQLDEPPLPEVVQQNRHPNSSDIRSEIERKAIEHATTFIVPTVDDPATARISDVTIETTAEVTLHGGLVQVWKTTGVVNSASGQVPWEIILAVRGVEIVILKVKRDGQIIFAPNPRLAAEIEAAHKP
jgi:hypothetical protein